MFKGKLEGSVEYVRTHRNVPPPLYNSRRLKELPIPLAGMGFSRFHPANYFAEDSDESSENDNAVETLKSGRAVERFDNDDTATDAMNETGNSIDDINLSTIGSGSNDENQPNNGLIHTDPDDINNTTDIASNIISNDEFEPAAEFVDLAPLTNNVEQIESAENASSLGEDFVNGEHEHEHIENVHGNDSETLIDQVENQDDEAIDPLANIEILTVRKIEVVPLYEINNADIDFLLDEPEELDSDDGIEIIGDGPVPQPFNATEDELIKRENDGISGSIPFNINVSV